MMRFVFRSSLLFLCMIFGYLLPVKGQQVIINEIYYNPVGSVETNSTLVTAPCADRYRAKEWIELYNPSPCSTADVSCWIIGTTLDTDTTGLSSSCDDNQGGERKFPNVGWFTIPRGTTIPPLGFLTIGGADADVPVRFPLRQFLPLNSSNFCGSNRFFLNSGSGWLALFREDGRTIIDGAYWTIRDQSEFRTNANFSSAYDFTCSCNRPTTIRIPSGRDLINQNRLRFIGNTNFTGVGDDRVNYHHRTVDGGCWKTQNGPGTSGACNSGTCFPLPQRPFINDSAAKTVCAGRPFRLSSNYQPPLFECPTNVAYRIEYQWRANGRNISNQPNFNGNAERGAVYTLTITINGCPFTDTARTNVVSELQPRFKADTSLICQKTEARLSYTGDTYDDAVYEWNFDGGTPATATGTGPHTVIWKDWGVKRVTVTAKLGTNCQNTFTDLVPVTKAPTGQHETNLSEVCSDEPVIISIKDLAPDSELFDWDFQGGNVSETPGKPNVFTVRWYEAGLKKITVKIRQPGNPCIGLPDTVNVLVKPVPISKFSVYVPPPGVCEAVQVRFTGFAPEGSKFIWKWDEAELFDPVLRKVVPKVDGFGPHSIRWYDFGPKTISVQVIARGCTSNVYTQTIDFNPYYLNIAEMDVPNAFSPNGDGINDFYELQNLREECAEYSMEIFNRWGDKIFEIPRISTRWDGIVYGQPAPEGAYTYKLTIKVVGEDTRTRVGTITLIR